MNFFYRIALWFLLKMGFYFWWSCAIYRRSKIQRKYKGHVTPVYTLEHIRRVVRRKEWKKDSWAEFGDAIGWPLYFERAPDKDVSGRDCDEYAVYILDAGRCEFMDDDGTSYAPVGMLTVLWRSGWKALGHNVALVKVVDDEWPSQRYYHASNWRNARLFGPFISAEAAAESVAKEIGLPLLAWNLRSPDLKKGLGYRFVGGGG